MLREYCQWYICEIKYTVGEQILMMESTVKIVYGVICVTGASAGCRLRPRNRRPWVRTAWHSNLNHQRRKSTATCKAAQLTVAEDVAAMVRELARLNGPRTLRAAETALVPNLK